MVLALVYFVIRSLHTIAGIFPLSVPYLYLPIRSLNCKCVSHFATNANLLVYTVGQSWGGSIVTTEQ